MKKFFQFKNLVSWLRFELIFWICIILALFLLIGPPGETDDGNDNEIEVEIQLEKK